MLPETPIWELTVSYFTEEQCDLERLCDLPKVSLLAGGAEGQSWILNPGVDLHISPKAQVDLTGSLKLTMAIYSMEMGKHCRLVLSPAQSWLLSIYRHATGPAHPSSITVSVWSSHLVLIYFGFHLNWVQSLAQPLPRRVHTWANQPLSRSRCPRLLKVEGDVEMNEMIHESRRATGPRSLACLCLLAPRLNSDGHGVTLKGSGSSYSLLPVQEAAFGATSRDPVTSVH